MVTLLIAEDDDDIRGLIVATVPDDWHVIEAADGIAAVALAREHEPDAIILDHRMPVLTGAEVCAILAKEPWRQHATIIGLTADTTLEVRREMSAAGVDAFLEKPFSPVELVRLLTTRVRHDA